MTDFLFLYSPDIISNECNLPLIMEIDKIGGG